MHWNVSIVPAWPIFGRFLTLFPSNVISIKTTRAARKKYLQYGGRTSMTSSRDVTASPLYNNHANICHERNVNRYDALNDALYNAVKILARYSGFE
jgi:hypothetical protein